MIKLIQDNFESLYEHANLRKNTTGQPFDFWVDEIGKDRKVSHNEPRFKVTANNVELDIILHSDDSITINNNDRDIRKFKYSKEAIKFVSNFKKPLRMHWNHEIDTGDLATIMRTVYKNDTDILDAISKVITGEI